MAVSRARRGSNLNWRWFAIDLLKPLRRAMARRRPFKTASQAQFWLEWRMRGWLFPLTIVLTTPLFVPLLIISRPKANLPDGYFLHTLVVSSLFFLFILGFLINGNAHWGKYIAERKEREPSSFLAIRPMSSAAMVAAKLKAAAASIMAAFCLAIIISIAVLVKAGCLRESGLRFTVHHSILLPVLRNRLRCAIITMIVACTWRLSVENILVTLSGRRWLTLPFIILIFPIYFISFNMVFRVDWLWRRQYLWEITQYAVWTLAAMKAFFSGLDIYHTSSASNAHWN